MTGRTSPPYAADEVTTLLAFLDYFRATLRRQTDDLDAAQLDTRLEPSTLTLGALLKHLALVESFWATEVFAGEQPGEPWAAADWDADPDWEITTAAHDAPEELRRLFDTEVVAADAVYRRAIADGGLDTLAARERHGERPSLRWILVHLVEEYARHCGHADLIRESIDGAVDL
ncbi:DinB family protein [Nocardioides sp.]|uniref:DinB family protein n=1 Tax=Nocardioides sp. TaxID=35761 RepID=UPI002ED4677F